jgi:mannose PTS system EIID component
LSPSLDILTLWRVFVRTFFIQASFSPEAMQSLGLLYALEPALRRLYPDETQRKEAVRRHLAPFNTHPYVAAGLIGGILFYEVRIARGEASADAVRRFKDTLMGPLAALGDGFFWRSLRPAAGALAAMLVPLIQLWAVVLYIVFYNLVHLWFRGQLFYLGWTLGEGIVARVSQAKLPTWGNRLRTVAAACSGALGAWLAMRFGLHLPGGWGTPLLSLGALALGMGTLALVENHVNPLWVLYGLAALAITGGALVT